MSRKPTALTLTTLSLSATRVTAPASEWLSTNGLRAASMAGAALTGASCWADIRATGITSMSRTRLVRWKNFFMTRPFCSVGPVCGRRDIGRMQTGSTDHSMRTSSLTMGSISISMKRTFSLRHTIKEAGVNHPTAQAGPARYPVAVPDQHARLADRTVRASSIGPATLDDIPDADLDRLAALGFDWVWFLSVWQTGPAGQQVSRTQHPMAQGISGNAARSA